MAMSSGLMTSLISTIEDTDTLPSLTPPSTAMWEWQSIMPGMTNWPAASMIFAPEGSSTFSPTSEILPSLTTIEPLSVPLVTVMMVALRITYVSALIWAITGAAKSRAMSAGFFMDAPPGYWSWAPGQREQTPP